MTIQEAKLAVMNEVRFEKDSKGYAYTYASLGNILSKLLPVLIKHKVSLSQSVTVIDSKQFILTTLSDGENSEDYVGAQIVEDPAAKMNKTQQGGSAITYAKRYSLTMLFALDADIDDDGGSKPVQNTGRHTLENGVVTVAYKLAQMLNDGTSGKEILDEEFNNFDRVYSDEIEKMTDEQLKEIGTNIKEHIKELKEVKQ